MRLIRSAALSPLLGTCALPMPNPSAWAEIVVTVVEPPPPLPVYLQPPIPEPGYIWTPGYWNYGDGFGCYCVPGTWIEAPRPGLLWTPGYGGGGSNAGSTASIAATGASRSASTAA